MGEQLCRRGQPQIVPVVCVLGICDLHVFHGTRTGEVHFLHQRRVPLPLRCLSPALGDLPRGGKHPFWVVYAVHAGRPSECDSVQPDAN